MTRSGVRISCTLWENYALEMHTHIESAGNRPLVVLLQLCRSNEYKGVGVSNTYFATKIELNAEIIEESISNMPQGQQETSYQISQASTISHKTPREEIESIIDDMTSLADIPTITMDQFVWVIGTISAVKEDNGWCFKSCIKCYRKVTSAGVGFKCEKCGPVSREIRFRLMVEICDGKGSLQLLLWDSCCKELVGQSAEEMLNRLEEDTAKQDNEPTFKGKGIVKQQFPDELHYLMGRELFFQLNVQKKNFESGDNVYVVKQVYEDAELLRRGKKSEAIEDDLEIGETDIAAEEDSVSNEVTSPARTPVKRCAGETSFDYSYDGCGSGSVQHSSNKLRKIIKQEKD